ncbi:MAG: PAS domain S-box protein [Deltaproteobacteria bacterium]|nr:PAS domain S-box protein [Deltaproteobacteria bacterium]
MSKGDHSSKTEADLIEELERLRREQAFTNAALDAQVDTFFIFEPSTGEAIRWNRAFRKITGYSDEEITRLRAPTSYYSPTDLERAAATIRQVLDGQAGSVELDLICKDGRKVPTQYQASVINDDDGKPKYMVSIGRDMSALRRSENALQESEERLRAVFGSMAEYLMVLDHEHRVQMINRVQEGRKEDEVVGALLHEITAPENRERLLNTLGRVVEDATTEQWDATVPRPDGSIEHFSSIAAPIIVSGKVVGSVVNSRDITDRVKLEEQYQQLQKMDSIGRLAGGVAHDFNNVLTVINSYASMAIDSLREGDPLRADIQQILHAGNRASTLTRQLLAFSRKQVMEPKVLDLNEVIVELEKMLKRLIGEDIECHTMLAKDLDRVCADPGQVEQVLMNLAVNARDAMPQGGKLLIKTSNVTLRDLVAKRYVMLTVSDNGVGICAEVKEHIFEPFFTTKDVGQGTGLGLATVYGIVKQSGGNIQVTSEPGKGTTFKIYLPQVDETKTEPPTDFTTPHLHGSGTVLVVEDEKPVRILTSRILTSAGYTVLTAANGGEALLECEQRTEGIDLVLTDVVMPKMGGKELADRLAKLCPNLKVLYMSGYTDGTIGRHGLLDEDTHFIAKPFSSATLLKKIRSVLED